MLVGIWGAGALGLLFAAKLSLVCSVVVITRTEEQAAVIRSEGIWLEGEGAPYRNMKAISIPDLTHGAAGWTAPDYIMLMVKQGVIDEPLLELIRERSSSTTKVICFQNGIGHEHQLRRVLGEEQVVLAVTTEGAKRLAINKVAHTGAGITSLEDGQKKCGFMLEKAGFEISLSKNMDTRVWSKLIMNSVINPLTAVLKKRNGELLLSPYTQPLMLALYQEGVTVAEALHIEIPDDLWTTLQEVCQRTANNHSSMLQDLMNERATEIDHINGSLLRIAEQHQLELPFNQVFYQLVKAMEISR
jgi:2-dehydropantoate 2-reductase